MLHAFLKGRTEIINKIYVLCQLEDIQHSFPFDALWLLALSILTYCVPNDDPAVSTGTADVVRSLQGFANTESTKEQDQERLFAEAETIATLHCANDNPLQTDTQISLPLDYDATTHGTSTHGGGATHEVAEAKDLPNDGNHSLTTSVTSTGDQNGQNGRLINWAFREDAPPPGNSHCLWCDEGEQDNEDDGNEIAEENFLDINDGIDRTTIKKSQCF